MARFMILIYEDEQKWIDMAPGAREALAQHQKFNGECSEAIVAGHALQPTAASTSIRDGAVTDGPFVETKEVLGGFYLVEAPDLDTASELAKQVPAPFGCVEVRPVLVVG